uniref:Uncharacterized protein n=1 Tax=Anguilla anguilla TaxID=7936 RepID=A0A0E9T9W4_ANGAN
MYVHLIPIKLINENYAGIM